MRHYGSIRRPSPSAVSIHAPTWGATHELPHGKLFVIVSIHAPTWGATISGSQRFIWQWFQSTHPHGVRQIYVPQVVETPQVSIHAPTWGATLSGFMLRILCFCFNPRTHMGCDFWSHRTISTEWSFNPRTHMGCDCACAPDATP